jgi:NADP-reducing hydrogenase subunit HndD
MTAVFLAAPQRLVDITVDGKAVRVPEGATLLEACRQLGIDTPTLCYLENLTPVNVCRVCVVEVEGSRTLVPACSRRAEPGMSVRTESERVRTSRRMVLEFLSSSVDMALTAPQVHRWMEQYGADPTRYGPAAAPHAASERDAARPGEHHAPDGSEAETVAQPVKYDNDSYVRDYSRCILCYKCVEACGGGSTRASLPSTTPGCPTQRACTAATASESVPPARSCRPASTSCGSPATGMNPGRP